MTRARTKADEERCVRKLLAAFSVGNGPPIATESPDFIVHGDDGQIGIEVVRLSDSRVAEGAASLRRFREDLARALRQRELALLVHAGITDGAAAFLGPAAVRARYVEAVCRLAELAVRDGTFPRTFCAEELRAACAPFLSELRVSRGDGGTVGLRAVGRRAAFVQLRIDEKNKKVRQYRANVGGGPIWLLLVAGESLASAVWSAIGEDETYVSAFDRTFWLDWAEERVFELTTRPPTVT